MVEYKNYYGKSVSEDWYIILTAADREGVRFTLTSGHRTMAKQWSLYRLYRSGRGNLAAFPSPNAPHIRTGRADHALDVDSLDGGETRLERWLERNGLRMTNPVRGESWHMEAADRSTLHALAARLDTDRTRPELRRGRATRYRPQVRKLQRYLRAVGYKSVSVNGRYDVRTRSAVKRFQRKHRLRARTVAVVDAPTWAKLIQLNK